MKKLSTHISAAVSILLFFLVFSAYPSRLDAQQYGQFIDRITATDVATILSQMNEQYYIPEGQSQRVVWVIDGIRALLEVQREQHTLCFLAYFDNQGKWSFVSNKGVWSLSDANDWNRKVKYSRVYIDNENDIFIQSDFDFDGGVMPDNVRDFVATCKGSLLELKQLLNK